VLLLDGTNVNHTLVKEGWCWWYRKYAPGDTRAGRVREGLFDFNKKPVIPDNTIYQIQRQLLSDPTRGFSFEGAPSHTHFGLAKKQMASPLVEDRPFTFRTLLKLNLTGLPSPDPDPG
jgi:hypothetical protein